MSKATDTVLQQLEGVRRSGKTNMYNISKIQRIAYEADYHELVCFIEEHSGADVIEAMEEGAELGYTEMDELPVSPVPDQISYEVRL